MGHVDELFDVIGRFGDHGCDFAWRNRGVLATVSVFAALLSDPESFIEGTRDLAAVIAQQIAQPIVEAGGQVGVEAARRTNWTLIGLVGLLIFAAARVGRQMLGMPCRK